MGAAPMAFMCPAERRARNEAWDFHARYSNYRGPVHKVIRTGRARANPSNNIGSRSLRTQVEYHCIQCGHVGWTQHIDILHYPVGRTSLPTPPWHETAKVVPVGRVQLLHEDGVGIIYDAGIDDFRKLDEPEQWVRWRML